ncbi:MAG: transglutaminase domain-containing protein [Candidatus Zixiibacteriota bacterium]
MRLRVILALLTALPAIFAMQTVAAPGDTLRSIATPSGYTQGLAFDGKHLWSCDRRNDQLYQIDPKDGHVVDSLSTPGYAPTAIAWDGKRIWCADAETSLLYAVNPTTRLTEWTISSPVEQPEGLAWDGAYLWVADMAADKLHKIDPSDGTTIVSIPSPTANSSDLTFYSRYLWAVDHFRDEIYMLTPDRGDVVITLSSPGKYPSGLAFDRKNLWVVDYQSDRIHQLVVDDGVPFARRESRKASIEFVHQVRNFGPDSVTTLHTYLAIPHDLDFQQLLGKIQYDPQPTDIVKDKWGQEVARFDFANLGAGAQPSVTMRVNAELFRVRYFVFPDKVGKLEDIPADIRSKYLADDIKFSDTSLTIQEALKAAVGSETNPYWIGRRIFNYLIEHLEYERVGGWNTAPAVLERGNGSCSEYSFVYIAMCRAAGLPARYVGSVVHRGEDACWDDVFHRWVEIYLPKYGWIPVDPSGGDSPWPQARANSFGYLDNRFLITTIGGGGSEFLEWSYNANERWVSKGKCKIVVESFAEWTPGETTK